MRCRDRRDRGQHRGWCKLLVAHHPACPTAASSRARSRTTATRLRAALRSVRRTAHAGPAVARAARSMSAQAAAFARSGRRAASMPARTPRARARREAMEEAGLAAAPRSSMSRRPGRCRASRPSGWTCFSANTAQADRIGAGGGIDGRGHRGDRDAAARSLPRWRTAGTLRRT